MFSENKSELSIPVVGFLLLGFATLFAGIAMLNYEWGFLENIGSAVTKYMYVFSGLLLIFGSLFAFRQVFLIEGMAFAIFGMFFLIAGYTFGPIASVGLLGFMLAVIAAILAFMSFRVGDLYLMLIGLFAMVAFIPLYFTESNIAIAVSAIGLIAVGVISIIYALMDWMLVQDIAADLAEYMYGDDECECGCGCEEHSD